MESPELLEGREHGDPMFRLQVYDVVLTRGPFQQTVNLHWHEETEFIFVTRGTVRIQVGVESLDVPQGCAVMVNSEELHGMVAPDGGPSECYAIVFDLNFLSSSGYDAVQHQFIRPLLEQQVRFPRLLLKGSPAGDKVLSCVQRVIELCAERPLAFEIEVKAALYLVLAQLFKDQSLKGDTETSRVQEDRLDRLKEVLTYIEQNIHQRLRLEELAHVAHMSEGYFCRFFREMTQQKPMQYINERRIQLATEMLQQPDLSVTSIALDLGFHDISYFTRVFRRFQHVSPLEYRRMMKEAREVRVANLRLGH